MNNSIFRAVREKYQIVEVANDLGISLHRVGSSLRANSIAGNGHGKDAFTVYEETNTWKDFMTGQSGDITDLVALVKYDGDKYKALCELMPECQNTHNFRQEISKHEEFGNSVKRGCDELFDENRAVSLRAKMYLNSRGITDETIKKLQIGIDYAGGRIRIRFPYWDQAGKRVLYFTTRRFDCNGNGENENEPKYMKASLEYHNYLRNAPLGLNSVKDDDFCIITEGMFDWIHCFQQGFSALSPNGCDFGKLWPEVIEVIKQHFKYVILAFDNDSAGIEATAKAAEKLMKEQIPFKVATIINVKDLAEYCEKGGSVQTLIDRAKSGPKWYVQYIKPQKEFDDLTVEERENAMDKCKKLVKTLSGYMRSDEIQEILLVLKSYFPKGWFSALSKQAQKGLTEDDVCERVLKKHKLMFNEKTGFYEFNDVWKFRDDTTIMSYIKTAYGIHATGNKLSTTLKLLKAHELVNSEAPLNQMNCCASVSFHNGTLHIDLKTGKTEFLPHSPDDFITVKLPYFYNPSADCKEWKKFLKDVTSDVLSYQNVLQEFAGYILAPHCKYQKALMLKGGGSNGKSVFVEILSALFGGQTNDGRGYVSYAEPSKFGKDFRLMPFRTSWLNISSDTESDMKGGEGVFKKIVAGEMLEDSYKHKDPFAFQTRTKLIACCNYFPTVSDTSTGFMRRWLIVPFNMHYVTEGQIRNELKDRLLDANLKDKLMKEMSGIFNWALEGLVRLIQQGQFTEIENHNKMINEFAKANNPLYCFVEDEMYRFYGRKKIHRTEFYNAYKRWAERSNIFILAANRFYSNFKSVLETYGISYYEQGRYWDIDSTPPETEEPPTLTNEQEAMQLGNDIISLGEEFQGYGPGDDRRQAWSDALSEILERYGILPA